MSSDAAAQTTDAPRSDLDQWLAQMRRYWPTMVQIFSGVVAVLGVVISWVIASGEPAKALPVQWMAATATVAAVAVFLVIRVPRVRNFVTWLLLPRPPAASLGETFLGPRAYRKEDRHRFPGRKLETQRCQRLIAERPFLIVSGESGCGKSSLLYAAVLPPLEDKFRIVTCRMGTDPVERIRAELRKLEPAVGKKGLRSALADVARTDASRPLLLVLDQFEELFAATRDETRQSLWKMIAEAVEEDAVRVVLTIRDDYEDLLLHLCREVDPAQKAFDLQNVFSVQAFDEKGAREVLGELLEKVHRGDPLRKQEVDGLADELTRDLLRPPRDARLCRDDRPTVLPVELQIVGLVLDEQRLHTMTAERYRRLGGKQQVFAEYLQRAKDVMLRKARIGEAESSRILEALISPAGTKQALRASVIDAQLGLAAGTAKQALEVFVERYLVNRIPGDDGEPLYELLHDHLVRLLLETGDPDLYRARAASKRLDFWWQRYQQESAQQQGPARWFIPPVPLRETLRLWRFCKSDVQRQMLWRSVGAFALNGTLACGALAAVLILAVPVRDARKERQQVTEFLDRIEERIEKGQQDDLESAQRQLDAIANSPYWQDRRQRLADDLELVKDLDFTRLTFATWSNGYYGCHTAIYGYEDNFKSWLGTKNEMNVAQVEARIEEIQKSPARRRIVEALDDWACLCVREVVVNDNEVKSLIDGYKSDAEKLLAIAEQCDRSNQAVASNKLRTWLRQVLRDGEVSAPPKEPLHGASVALIEAAGKLLAATSDAREGPWWRETVRQHPHDFWINVEMGGFLIRQAVQSVAKDAPFASTHPVTAVGLRQPEDDPSAADVEARIAAAEAAGFFRVAYSQKPDGVEVYLDLATALLLAGQHDEAIAWCEKAVGTSEEAVAAAKDEEELSQAKALLSQAHDYQGLAQWLAGDRNDEAIASFERAAEMGNTLARYHLLHALLSEDGVVDQNRAQLIATHTDALIAGWKKELDDFNPAEDPKVDKDSIRRAIADLRDRLPEDRRQAATSLHDLLQE